MSLKDLFKEQDNLKSAEPLTKEDFNLPGEGRTFVDGRAQ